MEKDEVQYVESGIVDVDINDDDEETMYINICHPLLVASTFLPNGWNWDLYSTNTNYHIKFNGGTFPNYSINLCIIVGRKSLEANVDTLKRTLDESKH
jgi:hypothetical protein